jgi:hypothetical protein
LVSGRVHSGNRRLFRCGGWDHRVLKCRSGSRCEIDTSSRINTEGTSVGVMLKGLVLRAVTQRKRGILWAVRTSITTFSVGSETSIGALTENWRRESGPPAGAPPRRLWRGKERKSSDRKMGGWNAWLRQLDFCWCNKSKGGSFRLEDRPAAVRAGPRIRPRVPGMGGRLAN